MPVRAVVFDLFDTVVDLRMEDLPEFELGGKTLRGTQGALHAVVAEHCDIELGDFVRLLRESDEANRAPLYREGREFPTIERFLHVVGRLGLSVPDLPERLTQTHMEAIASRAEYLEHHVDVMRALRERARTAICSNFSHTPTAMRVLEASGLAPHIDAVAISEEVGVRKPRPEIFRAALERAGVEPHEALHVGDRLDADVAGSSELGMIPVWITRRVSDPDAALAQHEGPAPTHVIEDLRELLDLV